MDKISVSMSIKMKLSEKKEIEFLSIDKNDKREKKDFLEPAINAELILNDKKIELYLDLFKLINSLSDPRNNFESSKGYYSDSKTNLYIVNSYCLVPSDEDIEEGIFVRYNEEEVYWYIRDKKTKELFGKNYYRFKRLDYELMIDDVLRYLHNNVTFNTHYTYLGDTDVSLMKMLQVFKDNSERYKEIY